MNVLEVPLQILFVEDDRHDLARIGEGDLEIYLEN